MHNMWLIKFVSCSTRFSFVRCWRTRNSRAQSHMRATLIVKIHPFFQDESQVALGMRYHPIQAFAVHRSEQPLADRIGFRAPHRGLQHVQPSGFYGSIQRLGKDAVPIMNQISISMLKSGCLTQLL